MFVQRDPGIEISSLALLNVTVNPRGDVSCLYRDLVLNVCNLNCFMLYTCRLLAEKHGVEIPRSTVSNCT